MNIRPFSWKVLVIAQDPASWLKIITQKQAQCGENIPRTWNKTENHWWSLGQEYSFQCSAAPYHLSTCEWAVGLVTIWCPSFFCTHGKHQFFMNKYPLGWNFTSLSSQPSAQSHHHQSIELHFIWNTDYNFKIASRGRAISPQLWEEVCQANNQAGMNNA